MPPPRKIDLIDPDLKDWLQDTLRERGFADYVEVTEELNGFLEERGEELRIGKSAVHQYGQDYQKFVQVQEQAAEWATNWMSEVGIEAEAKRHNALFQMVTTLAFKAMRSQIGKEDDEIDPKELHFIGRMLKDVMASSGMREQMLAAERQRVERETREAAAESVQASAAQLGLSADVVGRIKADILGVG